MKFWAAFGAAWLNRSTSMSPSSVEMVARVMLISLGYGVADGAADGAVVGAVDGAVDGAGEARRVGDGAADTVTLVIGTGSSARPSLPPVFAPLAISSTTSMPEVTWPRIA